LFLNFSVSVNNNKSNHFILQCAVSDDARVFFLADWHQLRKLYQCFHLRGLPLVHCRPCYPHQSSSPVSYLTNSPELSQLPFNVNHSNQAMNPKLLTRFGAHAGGSSTQRPIVKLPWHPVLYLVATGEILLVGQSQLCNDTEFVSANLWRLRQAVSWWSDATARAA